jgi:hypothetical protein
LFSGDPEGFNLDPEGFNADLDGLQEDKYGSTVKVLSLLEPGVCSLVLRVLSATGVADASASSLWRTKVLF